MSTLQNTMGLNSYHATTTAATSTAVAAAGEMGYITGIESILTEAKQFLTIAEAAQGQAKAKSGQIEKQAIGSWVQAGGSMAGAVIQGAGTAFTAYKTSGLQGEQTKLEGQLKNAEDLQQQFKDRATRTPSATSLDAEDLGQTVSPEVQNRIAQMTSGSFDDASANGMTKAEFDNMSPDAKAKASQVAKELNADAIDHMEPGTDDFKSAEKNLKGQVDNLTKKVNTVSNQITNETTKYSGLTALLSKGSEAIFGAGAAVPTYLSAHDASDQVLEENVSQLEQNIVSTEAKLADSGFQSMDQTTQMMITAAQINSSAA